MGRKGGIDRRHRKGVFLLVAVSCFGVIEVMIKYLNIMEFFLGRSYRDILQCRGLEENCPEINTYYNK